MPHAFGPQTSAEMKRAYALIIFAITIGRTRRSVRRTSANFSVSREVEGLYKF
jgi:hypothetical protein